jgi:hypothetical protein
VIPPLARAAGVVLVLSASAACAPLQPHAPAVAAAPVAALTAAALPSAAQPADESYDWRGLVPAPLGTEFASLHAGLHEVLSFHDAAAGAPPDALEAYDCYRSNAAGPRFVGRATTDYLWCFQHDRLTRIAAVVRLPSTDAPAAFTRYCDAWIAHADEPDRSPEHCAGRDGELAFDAHLLAPGADSTSELTIAVYRPAEH